MAKLTLWILSFCLVFASSLAGAASRVAFFELRQKDGQLIPLEQGGHFYHVAIEVPGGWMHAHPFYGVQSVRDIQQLGQLYSIIQTDLNPDWKIAQTQVGKKFSLQDPWNDSKSTYCSKLVAQILNLPPTLMRNGQGWGLSPDDLYEILKNRPHLESKSCRGLYR